MHMKKTKEDIGCGIALEVIGALIWVFSMSIRKMKTATYDISSAVFPRICGTLLLLLGLILIIGGVRRIMVLQKERVPEAAPADEADASSGADVQAGRQMGLIRVLIVLAAFALFVVALPSLGFIICGVILQFVLMAVMAPSRERTAPRLALFFAIALASATLVDLLFVRVFSLMLPAGLLSF